MGCGSDGRETGNRKSEKAEVNRGHFFPPFPSFLFLAEAENRESALIFGSDDGNRSAIIFSAKEVFGIASVRAHCEW